MTPLATLTTLGLGGPAAVVAPPTRADLLAFLAANDRYLVLGGGSNLVVGDAPLDGPVLHLAPPYAAVTARGVGAEVLVTAEAGAPWDAFVARAVEEGWAGLEALSGIPGTVGATPIQNVGAYGVEVADRLVSVEVWDRQLREIREFSREECAFRYRGSRFKDEPSRFVVLTVTFALPRAGAAVPVPSYAELLRALDGRAAIGAAELRATILRLRRGKGMVLDAADPDTRSAGSFFTNPIVPEGELPRLYARLRERAVADGDRLPVFPAGPGAVKLSAAWLIERAGFPRGYGGPAVHVSRKHTLALVHEGGARTEALLALAREIRDGVEAAFAVRLEPEPVFWGCAL